MKLENIQVGMRVEAGEPGSEDHDTGRVLAVDAEAAEGAQVHVGWDSCSSNWCSAESLRPCDS